MDHPLGDIWKAHSEALEGIPPRALLVRAIPFVCHRNNALDLGPGGFSDTKYLLSQNFKQVTAVDSADIGDRASILPQDKCTFIQASFDAFHFPEQRYDLVNAQFSLPFNPSETFTAMFDKIKQSLIFGGIFSGSFFGKKDSWNTATSSLTFHSEEEARALLSDMEVVEFNEREWDGTTASGKKKHWHVYDVIAKKLV